MSEPSKEVLSPTTRPKKPSIFDEGSRFLYLVAFVCTGAGVAFGVTAISIAFRGTGADVPTGDAVVEGELMPGRTVESPVGDPFLFGEVTLGNPGGSGIVDHRWRGPAGDRRVRVQDGDEQIALELPEVANWRGLPPMEERVVQNLSSLPIVSTVDQTEAHLSPPFAIAVRALRPGDAIVALTEPGADGIRRVTELQVGTRADLEADLERREAMRWPVVGLMGIMALASLGLGYRSLRRARS